MAGGWRDENNVFPISLIVGVVFLSHESAADAPKHRFSHGTVSTYSIMQSKHMRHPSN